MRRYCTVCPGTQRLHFYPVLRAESGPYPRKLLKNSALKLRFCVRPVFANKVFVFPNGYRQFFIAILDPCASD